MTLTAIDFPFWPGPAQATVASIRESGGAIRNAVTGEALALELNQLTGSTQHAFIGRDSGRNPCKRAFVVSFSINNQYVVGLLRLELYNGSLFRDLVLAKSISQLNTTVNAMDLSSLGGGHPTPQKDQVDSQALIDAGGSG